MIEKKSEYQICTNCVMDTSDSKIVFDKNGVCDFCNGFYNAILPEWKKNEGNNQALQEIALKIIEEGKGKEFDFVVLYSADEESFLPRKTAEESARNEYYVGLTRVKRHLQFWDSYF